MSAHTPTPWMVSDRFPYNVADDKIVVANCNTQANAARIVQCVNEYDGLIEKIASLRAERDALVEALREVVTTWDASYFQRSEFIGQAINQARKTLAKYEKK